MQLDVIEEGIEELTNMERFVLKTKPPWPQATALTVRHSHLLSCSSQTIFFAFHTLMGAHVTQARSC